MCRKAICYFWGKGKPAEISMNPSVCLFSEAEDFHQEWGHSIEQAKTYSKAMQMIEAGCISRKKREKRLPGIPRTHQSPIVRLDTSA
jgi:hypothetical protein